MAQSVVLVVFTPLSISWDMVGLYFYFVHALTVKLSVLALCRRIFGVNKTYRIWMDVLAIAQTVLFIIFCVF
ncbi:hypothetical protein GGS23DRAFT_594184 [Durotheca rogersii]|uniref:uncharacterized protein n=1 Tax=Durotheca rogersii TaxID=419775 RepID=UPI00221F8CAF|nr:uncharacterized protein GGS23DRAFT_594184 [Durotheca rogersii]KAI5866031.1 hypothetical protein GGS23DRAFT_594184 [Durotheca rogersii]